MGGRSLLLYAKAMVNVYTVHIRMSRVEVRIQEKGGVGSQGLKPTIYVICSGPSKAGP